jgi:hypothetical protein
MPLAESKGRHCQSTSLASMLRHTFPTFCDITESTTFALGGGAFGFGRMTSSTTLPLLVFGNGADYCDRVFALVACERNIGLERDASEDWVKKQILHHGRPVWTQVDMHELRYGRFAKVLAPFPWHKIIINGFDDSKQEWSVVDRDGAFTESYANMRRARDSPNNPSRALTRNYGVVMFGDLPTKISNLRDSLCSALASTAHQMLHGQEISLGDMEFVSGLAGMRAFLNVLSTNPVGGNVLSAAQLAHFAFLLEWNGTGGGAFRRLLHSFFHVDCEHLDMLQPREVIAHWAQLVLEAADTWTAFAKELMSISRLVEKEPEKASLEHARELLSKCIDVETKLWTDLDLRLGNKRQSRL